jgi:WD40 repeat protein
LIDLATYRLRGTLPAKHGAEVPALAFFPDGRRLVTGATSGDVTVWDVGKQMPMPTLRLRLHDAVRNAAVDRSGTLLALQAQAGGDSGSRVEVRDARSGHLLYAKHVQFGSGGLAFSPDGERLAALGCCDGGSSILVWDRRSGRELFRPDAQGEIRSIAFSPDGLHLAGGTGDGRVVFWNARDGRREPSPITAAAGAVDPVSFSPDGTLLAASSSDGTTTMWDLDSRKRLGNSFPIDEAAIPVARFERNGDLVIVYLGNATQWPTRLRAWERFACQVAGRDLTRSEWSELMPERAYRPICSAAALRK